jgi:hypothetical protein
MRLPAAAARQVYPHLDTGGRQGTAVTFFEGSGEQLEGPVTCAVLKETTQAGDRWGRVWQAGCAGWSMHRC